MTVKLACWMITALSFVFIGSALARGPWRANEGNTTGWYLMSPEERLEHQAKIRAFRSYDACHAYQLQHHRVMAARAAEKGLQLPAERRDFCEHLRPLDSSH
ncbi:MAG TPA: hypothetical protein VM532_09295 [Burkholderiales bacterium]|nr:hypothetical protein [Burkholderiales bacterium]